MAQRPCIYPHVYVPTHAHIYNIYIKAKIATGVDRDRSICIQNGAKTVTLCELGRLEKFQAHDSITILTSGLVMIWPSLKWPTGRLARLADRI